MSETTQTGKPGRYQRSTGGLIGSMIVLVVVVFGIILFRGAFRETPEYEPEHIDYLELVTSVQQLGLQPVYPPSVPEGWYAKAASFEPADRPVIDMVFTTADERTVGLHQEDTSEGDLLTTYVGEGVHENDDTLATDLGTWTGWEDADDGDHAWTIEVGDDTVLAYSSGDPQELRVFIESLTTAKLAP